jgi:acyl carrier protein
MISNDLDDVEAVVKEFILAEFLPGEAPDALTDTTPLLTTGILDSIATLQLVGFLERRFQVSIAPHEMNVDHLNSIATVAKMVRDRRKGIPA